MTRIAAKVREHKEANPRIYCPERRCLWRTGGGWCPNHNPHPPSSVREATQRVMQRERGSFPSPEYDAAYGIDLQTPSD